MITLRIPLYSLWESILCLFFAMISERLVMRLLPLLFSTAIIAGVVGVSSSKALAQNNVFLQPQTAWTLAQFDGKNKGDTGYCAIARRYESNVILTLAQNGARESSLAIDFQAARLDPDNELNVVIDAGGKSRRSFTIDPVSKQAFVVRLGRDDMFFNELERSGTLQATIGNRTFGFNMSDSGLGARQLDGCVTTLVNGGVETRFVSRSKATTSEDFGQNYRPEANNYANKLASLRREATELRAENKAYAEMVSAQQTVTPVDLPIQMPVSVPTPVLLPEIDRAGLEREARTARRATTALKESVEGQMAAYDAVKRENDRLRKALVSNAAGGVGEERLRSDVVRLQSENEFLISQLAEAEASLGLTKETLEQSGVLDARARELEMRVGSLRSARDVALLEVEGLKARNAGLQESLNKMAAVEAQSSAVSSRLDYLTAEIGSKDQKILEMGRALTELESVRSENKELRQQILNSDYTNAGVITGLKGRVARLEKENIELHSRMQAMVGDSEQGLVALRKAGAMELRIATLREENNNLRKALGNSSRGDGNIYVPVPVASPIPVFVPAPVAMAAPSIAAPMMEEASNKISAEDLFASQEDIGEDTGVVYAEISDGDPIALIQTPKTQNITEKTMDVSLSNAVDISYPAPLREQDMFLTPDVSGDAYEAEIQASNEAERYDRELASNDGRAFDGVVDEVVEAVDVVDNVIEVVEVDVENSPALDPDILMGILPMIEETIVFNQSEAERKIPAVPQAEIVSKSEFVPELKAELEPEFIASDIFAPIPSSAPVPTPSPAPAQVAARPVSDGFSVSKILRDAAINITEEISMTIEDGQRSYHWGMGAVKGFAEQRKLVGQGAFDRQVKNYLEKEQANCTGDFAVLPDMSTQRGNMRIDTYEVACVGSEDGTSTSLLFFNQGASFAALSHKASTHNMATAMDARDRVLKVVKDSSKI